MKKPLIVFLLLSLMISLTACSSESTSSGMEMRGDSLYISADSELLKYTGRWQKVENGSWHSYWNNPSVSLHFSGSETLKIELTANAVLHYTVDDVERQMMAQAGTRDIKIEGTGEHTVTLVGSNIEFTGFLLDKGAKLSRVADKQYYIEFIGDSITYAPTGFSYQVPKMLDVDGSVCALNGISLCDGWGYYEADYLDGWDTSKRIGMSTAYFNCETPLEKLDGTTPYQFGGRKPDVLFIFLGTNDYLNNSLCCKTFSETYVTFVGRLRELYPDAAIYVAGALTESTGLRIPGVEAAAQAVVEAVSNVKFVDMGAWEPQISGDGVHPTQEGYDTLAEKIAEYLAAELGLER